MSLPSTFCLTTAIPGPPGAAGTNGTNGTNGVNAYTFTSASFVMPAENGTVVVAVLNSDWMSNNQVLYVDFAGYMSVDSTPTSTSVTLRNIEDTATGAYTGNAAPATVIPNVSSISPAGIQGPAGAAGGSGAPVGATYIVQTADGTLTNEQALAALATGFMFSTTATGVVTTIANPIPIANGGTSAATATAAFDALAPTTTDGDIIYFDGTDNIRLATSGAATRYLSNTGVNNRPLWAQVDLTNGVTGVLPVANGGTGGGTGPAFFAHRNGVVQSIAAGGPVAINWTNESIDTTNAFDPATERFTPAVAGNYWLHCQIKMDGMSADDTATVTILEDGVAIATHVATYRTATTGFASVSILRTASATNYYTATVAHSNVGSMNMNGGASVSYFCGYKVP